MGQYLAISIINEHTVSKKNLEKYQITAQEVSLRARFDESIYEFSEHEQYYAWTIRKEILETNLIAFLEDIKREFREWYSIISTDEIISNPSLIRIIERMEKILVEATVN